MMWRRMLLREMMVLSICKDSLSLTRIAFLYIFRLCGHKNDNAVWDDRLHGFPFDRNIAFNLKSLKGK